MPVSNQRKTLLDLYQESRNAEYESAKDDLGSYVQAAWPILEPTTELKWNWHHDYITEYLMAAHLGQVRRLIINVCPRSTKSLITSVSFPTWVWAHNPSARFLFGSHSDALATEHSVLRKNLLEHEWYRNGFGDMFKMSDNVNAKSNFANDKTGRMMATGILGSIMGKGGDYIIIDDPHDPKKAASNTEREKAISNFDLSWSNRLNDKKTGRIIVIMQRLHEKDLTGHLIAKNLGYEHIKIPTIAEEKEVRIFPLSGHIKVRQEGELLHPERDGPEQIEQAKEDLGPFGFSGQHQQSPTPKSGGLFSPDMFEYVDLPTQFDWGFITADTSYNDRQENDFTVFTAWGVVKGELYIRDVWRRQIKAAEVEIPAVEFIKRFQDYGFRGAYIEPKGHGIYLNQKLPSHGVLIPSETKRADFFSDRKLNKTERANNAVPHLANRVIRIGNTVKNKEYLVQEALVFPKGTHDDFVDTLVDGIKLVYARKRSTLDVL